MPNLTIGTAKAMEHLVYFAHLCSFRLENEYLLG